MRLPPVLGGSFRPHLRINRFRARTSAEHLDAPVFGLAHSIYGGQHFFLQKEVEDPAATRPLAKVCAWLQNPLLQVRALEIIITSSIGLRLRLADDAPGGIQSRGDLDPLVFRLAGQGQRPAWACRYTKPAANAALRLQGNPIAILYQGLHLAPVKAGPAPLASFGRQCGDESTGNHVGRPGVILKTR